MVGANMESCAATTLLVSAKGVRKGGVGVKKNPLA